MKRNAGRLLSLVLGVCLTVGLAVSPAFAMPDEIVYAAHRGWWTSDGASGNNDNYCVGIGCNSLLRENNFFVFDLPSSSEGIMSASLSLANPDGYGVPRTYSLHSVTSKIPAVLAVDDGSKAGKAVFNDLGDGTVLGSETPGSMAQASVLVGLNTQGMIALQKKLGSRIAIGGALEGEATNEFLFGSSGGVPASGTQLYYYLGPKTQLKLRVPREVRSGTRVRVLGRLVSTYGPCQDSQDVEIRFGSVTKTKTTNASGKFTIAKKVAKKTRISVLYAGGFGASDQGCGVSAAKKVVRIS